MSGHRWKVGDRARLRYVRGSVQARRDMRTGAILGVKRVQCPEWRPGIEVIIVSLTPGLSNILGNPYDCIVDYPGRRDDRAYAKVLFDQLEPIIERGSWDEIERSTGWRPTKRRRVSA